jgi:hypothetical protein
VLRVGVISFAFLLTWTLLCTHGHAYQTVSIFFHVGEYVCLPKAAKGDQLIWGRNFEASTVVVALTRVPVSLNRGLLSLSPSFACPLLASLDPEELSIPPPRRVAVC